VNINNITVPDNFYGACVRVLVHRWGGERDEASQEGLFKLVEAIDAGKKMDNVTSYIARALNNKEIEKFRRRVRFNHVSFEGCEEFEAREELLFYDKLTGEFENTYGREFIDELEVIRQESRKYYTSEVDELKKEFQGKIKEELERIG